MSMSTFKTVREFCDHVGCKRLADKGAYSQVVHNWIRDGKIPSVWLQVFIDLHGPDLPMHLFKFRQAKTIGAPA